MLHFRDAFEFRDFLVERDDLAPYRPTSSNAASRLAA